MLVRGEKSCYLKGLLLYLNQMKPLILLLSALLLISCHKHVKIKTEITKIELATGADCMGPCQHTALAIDSSLCYQFYAAPSRDSVSVFAIHKKGFYTGTISEPLWDSLVTHLEAINYSKLDTSYNYSADDQSLELVIHYGNKIKHIKAQSASLPDKVRVVFYEIANSYKTVNLKKVEQPIKFETTYQQRKVFTVSNSVSLSKRLKAFICEYKVNDQKINGHAVLAVFAEKEYTIDDFGVSDINKSKSQLVVVLKSDAVNDDAFNTCGFTWRLSNDHGELRTAIEFANLFTLYVPKEDLLYPAEIKFLCSTNIDTGERPLLTKDIVDDHIEVPIKTRITFYKMNR